MCTGLGYVCMSVSYSSTGTVLYQYSGLMSRSGELLTVSGIGFSRKGKKKKREFHPKWWKETPLKASLAQSVERETLTVLGGSSQGCGFDPRVGLYLFFFPSQGFFLSRWRFDLFSSFDMRDTACIRGLSVLYLYSFMYLV